MQQFRPWRPGWRRSRGRPFGLAVAHAEACHRRRAALHSAYAARPYCRARLHFYIRADFRTGRNCFARGALMAAEMDDRIQAQTQGKNRCATRCAGCLAGARSIQDLRKQRFSRLLRPTADRRGCRRYTGALATAPGFHHDASRPSILAAYALLARSRVPARRQRPRRIKSANSK